MPISSARPSFRTNVLPPPSTQAVLDALLRLDLNLHAICVLHLLLREGDIVSTIVTNALHSFSLQSTHFIHKQYYYYLQKISTIHDLYLAIKTSILDRQDSVAIFILTAHKL